ncbi:Subunit of heteropentameric Replication factor C (RF-C) [Tilletia horrida]|uniref:Replication factor C subunit 3 n=1 Tax=Tilletia horrida TaxID=155126 RepID=A0AAN6G853_9BASI|nr:Subunit of heteropentameric Replication factor C (RF-C) [Tilletia horrida]
MTDAQHDTKTLLDPAVERFIEKNRLPHMLFYGPPGTGKTSTVLAMARKLYGPQYKKMTLEVGNHIHAIWLTVFMQLTQHAPSYAYQLNASDDRGIDVVREQIKTFASSRDLFSKPGSFKLIILDEADAMTTAAQGALRRVIEQYTRNVRFCIICNYVNKIIPAIQSRCTRFRFSPLETDQVKKRLDYVVANEDCKITPEGMTALLKLTKGDMRRALSVLQACHAAYSDDGNGRIDEEAVYNCTGNPRPADVRSMVHSMMKDEFTTAYNNVSAMKLAKGMALADLITGVFDELDAVDFSPEGRIFLLDHLAHTEHRLSTGGSEKIQLTALVGAVQIAVALSQKKGKK